MSINTAIKTWQERRSEYYGVGGAIRIRSDGYFKCGEIAELRAALEVANHRIEDLTTAANRCINDALGMASTAQQSDGVIYETVSARTSPKLHAAAIEASSAALKQDDGEWQQAELIRNLPAVHEMIQGFADDQTGDNATMVVREVMRTIAQRAGSGEGELRSATSLASAIWRDNYKTISPDWKPLPDLMGVISQIDNMICGLVLKQPDSERDSLVPSLKLSQVVEAHHSGYHSVQLIMASAKEAKSFCDSVNAAISAKHGKSSVKS